MLMSYYVLPFAALLQGVLVATVHVSLQPRDELDDAGHPTPNSRGNRGTLPPDSTLSRVLGIPSEPKHKLDGGEPKAEWPRRKLDGAEPKHKLDGGKGLAPLLVNRSAVRPLTSVGEARQKADALVAAEQGERGTRRMESSETRFPTEINDLVFVAGAHRVSHVAGMTFHVFDIGLYVDKRCPLWNRKSITPEEVIDEAPGYSMLRLEITSGSVTGKRLASSINNIVKKHMSDKTADQAMTVFVKMVQGGPALHVGSVIDMHIIKTGLRIEVDGVDLGVEVSHPSVATAMIATYVDANPDIASFKESIMSHLSQGFRKIDGKSFKHFMGMNSGMTAKAMPKVRTLVLVIVPSMACFAILSWCLFRSQLTARRPNPGK